MNDVMLDFETLGKGPNKAICQVGAIYFDRVTGELGEEFTVNIDAESHEAYGGKLDANTVYWWLAQSDAARQSLLQHRVPIVQAMTDLNKFLEKATRIWSHATFDFVTLMDTLKQLSIKPSFTYKEGMDLRTLIYLAGISTKGTSRAGVHHNALDDCKHQVKYCVAALNAVKTNKQIVNFINRVS